MACFCLPSPVEVLAWCLCPAFEWSLTRAFAGLINSTANKLFSFSQNLASSSSAAWHLFMAGDLDCNIKLILWFISPGGDKSIIWSSCFASWCSCSGNKVSIEVGSLELPFSITTIAASVNSSGLRFFLNSSIYIIVTPLGWWMFF